MTETEQDLDRIKRTEAALELIHCAGGEVTTKAMAQFEDRDWESERFLDLWVGRYTRNIAEHYHEILRSPDIGPLCAAAPGCAVAVVGAGPSLDKNVEALRDFPGLIIACDRAGKALTARGIRPDLVACVDPRPAVIADFLDYPENREQNLVMSVVADPEVSRVWRGKVFYASTYHIGTQFFDRVLPELFPGMPGLFALGNVGNTAVQLADFVGAERIVLVGQDYGYPGGRTHCDDWVRLPNGAWQRFTPDAAEAAAQLERRTGKVEMEGTLTYPAFLSYRETLGLLVKELELDLVNCTEGGILNNLPQARLKDEIESLLKNNYNAGEARAQLAQATGGLK